MCSSFLEGTRDGCLLGEPTRRRPVLPGPTPPRRPAACRPAPTRPWYVRVLDSTSVRRMVYMGIRLLVLPKQHSGLLCSMPWRPWVARGEVVSWANRPVSVPSPAPPRRPVVRPPRPNPPVVYPGFGFDMFVFYNRLHNTKQCSTEKHIWIPLGS